MQKIKREIILIGLVFILFFLSGQQGLAVSLEKELDDVQMLLEKNAKDEQTLKKKAYDVSKEVYDTRKSLIETAKKVQNYEEGLSKLEKSFDGLKAQEQEILENIRAKKVQIARLLAVLQSISLRPVESLLMQDVNPISTLRSSLLMRDTVPLIARETDKLKKDMEKLADVRENIREQYLKIKKATASLKEQQKQVDTLLKRKVSMQKEIEVKAERMSQETRALAKKAKDLQELILEIERRRKEQAKKWAALQQDFNFEKMKGKISLPVKGNIVKKYGETLESGIVSRGILIRSRDNAQVVAPFDGNVVFSGPFRSYKDVLIIDHGGGYHTLLAGMEKNDTFVGQNLLAGEPVGQLSSDNASLYVEIRERGEALNPTNWFIKVRN